MPGGNSAAIVILEAAPLVTAPAVTLIVKSRMKSAVVQKSAGSYIPDGGFELTESSDMFVRTDVRRERSSPNGGTGIGGDGFSGGSGKF